MRFVDVCISVMIVLLILAAIFLGVFDSNGKVDKDFIPPSTYGNFTVPGTNYTCIRPILKDGFYYCNIDDIKDLS